jgi:ABC-type branched-subunit amino acid transport system permease subunit
MKHLAPSEKFKIDWGKYLGSAELLSLVLVLVPLLLVPYAFPPYAANALALFLIYGLLATSLGLIWGFAGIISFGQNTFFGVAAYTYGIVAVNVAAGSRGNIGLAVLAGTAAATVMSLLLGWFLFYGRLSDVYASIILLVVSLVLYVFGMSTAGDEWVVGTARLGGFNGLFGQGLSQNAGSFQIPPLSIWLYGMDQPFAFRIDRRNVSGYYLVLGTCLVVLSLARMLLATRLGRIALTIRENEARAASFGYDVRAYKLAMFTVAGAIAGTAGVLFVGWGRFVNPEVFSLTFAASVVVYVLLGGRLTLAGGFVGAVLINYLTSYLAGASNSAIVTSPGILFEVLRRLIEQAPLLVQGVALIATVFVLKRGIAPPVLEFLAHRSWIGWLILLPAVVAYFVLRVVCIHSDFCLL